MNQEKQIKKLIKRAIFDNLNDRRGLEISELILDPELVKEIKNSVADDVYSAIWEYIKDDS